MASYTLELRELIEQATQFEELSHTERIKKGRPILFNFPYPIFDENYRNVFETNFIRNFYMREIGFETEGLFKFRLETWLNINMPYFNKMFESEQLKYNPLTNVDNRQDHNKKSEQIRKDLLDKTKKDIKNIINDEQRNITNSVTNTSNQNDDKNTTSISDRLINDKIDKDVNRTDKVEKTVKENEVTINKTVGEQTTTTDSNIDGTSEGKSNSYGEELKQGQIKNIDFTRDLESDTPDSRLAITTQDGDGIIEYASNIKEKDVRKTNISNDKMSNKNDTTTNDKTNTKSKQNLKDNSSENFDGNRNKDINDTENLISNIKDSLQQLKNDNLQERGNEILKRIITEIKSGNTGDKLIGKLDEIFESVSNETLNSEINSVEDFVQNNFGKIGVVSFPQLVKEYRESLLRIENQIFNEMNELFMLVY